MKRLILTIAAVIAWLGLWAENTPVVLETWFGSEAAGAVFPNLDKNARLDMLDYYKSGLDTPSTGSYYKEPVNITRLENSTMQIKSDDLTVDLYVVAGKDKTVIVVVENIPLGAGDSVVKVYDIDGNLDSKAFAMPEYSEWLVKDALKMVPDGLLTSEMPYVTATATVDTASGKLTLTNTAVTVPGTDAGIAAVFKPALVYVLKDGVFKLSR